LAKPVQSLIDLEEAIFDIVIRDHKTDRHLKMLLELHLQAVAVADFGGKDLGLQVVQSVVIHGAPGATGCNLGMWPEVSANCNLRMSL
jgi:hypothetical protein